MTAHSKTNKGHTESEKNFQYPADKPATTGIQTLVNQNSTDQ